MSLLTWRSGLLVSCLLVAGGAVWPKSAEPRSLPRDQDFLPPETGQSELKLAYISEKTCSKAGCHGNDTPLKAPEGPLVCLCTESKIYELDKHKHGFDVLTKDRAKAMQVLLPEYGDVTRAQACVSCHAGVTKREEKEWDVALVKEGVTCVICHGYRGTWIDDHASNLPARKNEWRKRDRVKKQSETGMIDLWNPSTRSKVCASCHIGNFEEGKFVTHAMYAAGHPPLPSFELATFSEQMPRHWQYLREKDKVVQAIILKHDNKEIPDHEVRWEQSRLVLINGAVSLRESLSLIASMAKECEKDSNPTKRVLDYAVFDCSACHHELKNPSWRQDRVYLSKPGRPYMQMWPTTLTRISMGPAGIKETELESRLKKLADAFSIRPFGDPSSIARDAGDVVGWMNGVIERLTTSTFDEASAIKFQKALATFNDHDYPDYESARQRAWAFIILSDELEWKQGQTGEAQKRAYKKRLEDVNKRLGGRLLLDLPSGQNKEIMTVLPTSLSKMGEYEPKQFRQDIRKLLDK
jgi:hypothetical protein